MREQITICFIDEDALVNVNLDNLDARVTCIQKEIDFSKSISSVTFDLEREYGDLFFWDNNRFITEDRIKGYLEVDNQFLFNPSLNEISVSQYFEYINKENKHLLFYKQKPAIGGGEGTVHWFLFFYNLINDSIINHPLFWLIASKSIRYLYKWAIKEFQSRKALPEYFLLAVYSKEKWTVSEFDHAFRVKNEPISRRLLLSLGYKKKGGVYILHKEKHVDDFKFEYVDDETIDVYY